MVSFSFLYPWNLIFLLIIPLFFFIHIVSLKSSKKNALKFANFQAIARIQGVDIISKNITILVLSVFIVVFIVLGISGFRIHAEIDSSSSSYVIAIDNSQSMGAGDVLPSRIEIAKEFSSRFVDETPFFTRIGVISFSGNSLIEQEITDNKLSVKNGIEFIGLSELSGTDFNDAVFTSYNILRNEEYKSLIMLSDGQSNVGALGEAIAYANDKGLVIHTVAIGTIEGGETRFGLSKLNEDSLKALAFNTGGQFFKISDNFNVDTTEAEEFFVNVIQKTNRETAIVLSNYLFIAALILFSIEFILINTKFRRVV